ncbi:MAG: DUF58 domain-containing protein [Rickettsiales bacterium]|jgi:uncharacterized protein (DUF58 family)|nr:DUF58 domain-containing protein [Rickettsiales bacterium]
MDKYGLYPDFKVLEKISSFVEHEKIKLNSSYVSSLSGAYRSKYKSSGLIFDNVRRYQFGDDKRRIDWKASARTGKLYVKEFIEERNTELLLVLNNSSEMLFASKHQFKSYISLEVFTFLASLALANKDYIRPYIFISESEDFYYSKTNMKANILEIIAKVCSRKPSKNNELSNLSLLKKLVRSDVINKNIFLILPIMYDFDDRYREVIKKLAISNQLNFIFVWDDLERNLPYLNNLEVRNINDPTGYLVTSNRISRQKYQEIFDSKKEEIDEFLTKNQVNSFYINTKDNTLLQMAKYFG